MANSRTNLTNNSNSFLPVPGKKPRTSQLELEIKIARQKEINGVGMGVLSDGTPYLTGRGLARLCGVDSSRISELTNDWIAESKTITKGVKKILRDRGIAIVDKTYVKLIDNGNFFMLFQMYFV